MNNLPQGAGIVLRKGGKIALSLRTNTKTLSGFWQFPGGTVEPNEAPKEAAVRELQEETGLRVSPDRFIHLGTEIRETPYRYLMHIFSVILVLHEEPVNLEPEKQTDWEWVYPEQAKQLQLIPGTEKYL